MDMTGEYRIQAPRQRVWEALNDPEVLKQSIPGCQEIDKQSDTEMTAKVTAKVGPVKANFTGQVTLSDLNPPESYRISGEGKGGAAGFAKGGANVSLAEDGDATILSYDVNATVGGKLAQLGARLIDGTAKKMANEFFTKFAEVVESGEGGGTQETAAPPAPSETPVAPTTQPIAAAAATEAVDAKLDSAASAEPAEKQGVSTWVWVAGVVIAVGVALLLLT